MGMVTIEESDDEKSIVTPNLRLRFRWTEDRWTHAIEIGPAPWVMLAEAVEWSPTGEDSLVARGAVFQEIHFQEHGGDVLALLVGQAGPHHFSASFRVRHETHPPYGGGDFICWDSYVEVDLADRCRVEGSGFECHYVVRNPPAEDNIVDDNGPTTGSIVWEGYQLSRHAAICGSSDEPQTLVHPSQLSRASNHEVRIVQGRVDTSVTRRLRYYWNHEGRHESSSTQG